MSQPDCFGRYGYGNGWELGYKWNGSKETPAPCTKCGDYDACWTEHRRRVKENSATWQPYEHIVRDFMAVLGNNNRKGLSNKSGDGLETAVKRYPTPTVMDAAGFCGKPDKGRTGPNSGRTLTGKVLEMEGLGPHAKPWPTPTARDATAGARQPDGKRGLSLVECAAAGGQRMWPTPKASMSGPDYARVNRPNSGGDDLATAVAREETRLWATPCASDGKRGHNTKTGSSLPRQVRQAEGAGGQLNPNWVEWLMGWPIGWTESGPLEMARFREWLELHGYYLEATDESP